MQNEHHQGAASFSGCKVQLSDSTLSTHQVPPTPTPLTSDYCGASPEALPVNHLVEIGPGAADKGGKLVYAGDPKRIHHSKESLLASHLAEK